MGKINTRQLKVFLEDFIDKSETMIIEEGSERKELEAIAKKHNIIVKGSTDLAIFKTIYALTDVPNANGAILPKKEILRSLPTLIGKPIDIDHDRRYVIGYYIDYKYIHKSGTIVAYGIFFKSNFAEEWEEAKRLFKKRKLSTSFEIWSPRNKRKKNPDGTYELYDMEIAGGALIYKTEPAFKEAKVLDIAKKNIEHNKCDLILAKKEYNADEVMCVGDLCSSATLSHIVCPICGYEFEQEIDGSFLSCPSCNNIFGVEKVANQTDDIESGKVRCPNCNFDVWQTIESAEEYDIVRCLSCNTKYKFIYESLEDNIFVGKLKFMLQGSTSCVGCGETIKYTYYNNSTAVDVRCKNCGLQYEMPIKSSVDRGGKTMKKIEKIGELEISKFHRYFETEEEIDNLMTIESAKKISYQERKSLSDKDFAVIIRVKNKKTGKIRKVRMFVINDEAHVRNALARLNQPKVKETLKRYKVSVDKALRNILKKAKSLNMISLLKRHEKDCKRLGISCPKEMSKGGKDKMDQRKRVAEKLRSLRKEIRELREKAKLEVSSVVEKRKKTLEKYVELRKKVKEEKEIENASVSKLNEKRAKLLNKYKEIRKEKKEIEEKIEMYKANAVKLIERRAELGDYAENMTDEQILDDKEFEIAKLRKENEELKAKKLNIASGHVGNASVDEELLRLRKEIDKRAFGV